MLIIKTVEYSKNPVAISEAFIISMTIEEIIAMWSDLNVKTWGEIKQASSWENVKLKYF